MVSGELHIIVIISREPLTLAEKYFVCVFLNGEQTACREDLAQDELPKELFYSPDRQGRIMCMR